MRSRSEVVNLAISWLGKNERDGSYKSIIDIYNSFKGPFPRGIKMKYEWSWCACTWSAIAIALGYTDIMPIEISCGELIKQAQRMGCWQENDGYIPLPGDAILYDWDDNGVGDNTKWPDHVGIIRSVHPESGCMKVIEGNYSNSVKERTVSINGKYIRGFITPKYTDNDVNNEDLGVNKGTNNGSTNNQKDEQVSNKKVETTCYAKSKDSSLSGTYTATTNLNCRNDAGTDKKVLCVIPKGTKVQNYGFYTNFNGVKWLLIQFTLNGIQYKGFSSSKYLER